MTLISLTVGVILLVTGIVTMPALVKNAKATEVSSYVSDTYHVTLKPTELDALVDGQVVTVAGKSLKLSGNNDRNAPPLIEVYR